MPIKINPAEDAVVEEGVVVPEEPEIVEGDEDGKDDSDDEIEVVEPVK
jgi:hypothetical protein